MKIRFPNYRKVAYMLVSRSYKCGKEDCREYLMFQSDGNISKLSNMLTDALAIRVTERGEVLAVSNEKTLLFNKHGKVVKEVKTPESLIDAAIGSNIAGDISVLAVTDGGALFIGDGFSWSKVKLSLSSHGDRKGVLSVYPKSEDEFYLAIYRYINAYNKGLYLMHINTKKEEEHGGWLFNSEDRNIGFDPEIYLDNTKRLIISTSNSSNKSDVHFSMEEEDVNKLNPSLPRHVVENGFAKENIASFMIGAGISLMTWEATSKVEKGDITYTDVDYLIADTQFTSANAEGSFGDTSLTINFLQNQAEDITADEISTGGGTAAKMLSKKASSYLFSTIDFQGLISPSASLRLQVDMGETNGVAKVMQKDGSVNYQTFSTKMKRFAALVMKERGKFYGVDYLNYTMPSAVGFSDDSKQIVYSDFDPEFGFYSLRAVAGYDALAYAKRYETDYSRLYLSGSGNFGLGWADISSKVERDALTVTGASRMEIIPSYFVMGFDLEGGHLWQQRSKKMRGLGYSVSLGYRVNYTNLSAGQDEDDDPDKNTLYLEFERHDFMHGPFLKVNVIF